MDTLHFLRNCSIMLYSLFGMKIQSLLLSGAVAVASAHAWSSGGQVASDPSTNQNIALNGLPVPSPGRAIRVCHNCKVDSTTHVPFSVWALVCEINPFTDSYLKNDFIITKYKCDLGISYVCAEAALHACVSEDPRPACPAGDCQYGA